MFEKLEPMKLDKWLQFLSVDESMDLSSENKLTMVNTITIHFQPYIQWTAHSMLMFPTQM